MIFIDLTDSFLEGYFFRMNRVGDLMRQTVEKLKTVLGDLALPYTERIFEHLLCCSRSDLYLKTDWFPEKELTERLSSIVNRCLDHEPLDYITGISYFFNREFVVTPAVLLPRPDTEQLVECVLSFEEQDDNFFADIGTGSGIIACILTEERPRWTGVGADISMEALSVARRNVRSDRVMLVCCDLLSALAPDRRFDFIVSNPPYIASGEIEELDESVRRFEPRRALDGGEDGLDFYRRFAREAACHLKPGGRLYCEIGFNQEEAVKSIFCCHPWEDFQCFRDLSDNPRVITARVGRRN